MDGDLSLKLTHSRGVRPARVHAVALSNNPDRVYTLESDAARSWIAEREAATFTELARIDRVAVGLGLGPWGIIISGDGRLLVTVVQQKEPLVCVHDRSTGRTQRAEVPGRFRSPAVRWATDGATVAVSMGEGTWHLFDVREVAARGAIKGEWLATSDGGELIAFTRGRQFVLVRTGDVQELGRWAVDDPDPWQRLAAISQEPVGLWCVCSARGAPCDADVWWCEPGRPATLAGRYSSSDPIVAARASGQGLTLVTARCEVAHMRPDERTGGVSFEPRRARRGPGVVGAFRVDGVSPDGRRCAGRIGHVPVQVDLVSGEVTTWGDGPSSNVAAIAASHDGRLLGVAWSQGDVAVLDADTLATRWTFEVEDGPLVGCAISPDNRTLYTLTDSRLRSWDLSVGLEVACVPIPGPVRYHYRGGAVRASMDGRHLLIGPSDHAGEDRGAWLLVDLFTGAVITTPRDEAWRAEDAVFAADGGELVMMESSRGFFDARLRTVAFDIRAERARDDRLLRPARAAVEISRREELDFPVLIEEGRALLGAPWASGRTSSYLRWDLADNVALELVVPACGILAHAGSLGAFSAATTNFGQRVVLRDLATLRERASVTFSADDSVNVAAIVGEEALIVGLADGRILRFAIPV